MSYYFKKLKKLSEDLSIDITFSSITNEVCIFTENDNEYRVKGESEFDNVINALGVLKGKHVSSRYVSLEVKEVESVPNKPKEFPKIQIPVYGKSLSDEEVRGLFEKLFEYGYEASSSPLDDEVDDAQSDRYGYILTNTVNNTVLGFRCLGYKTIQPEDLDSFLASLNKD